MRLCGNAWSTYIDTAGAWRSRRRDEDALPLQPARRQSLMSNLGMHWSAATSFTATRGNLLLPSNSQVRGSNERHLSPQHTPELSVGWVDPWVGLGRDYSVFVAWVGSAIAKVLQIWKDNVNAFKARLDKIWLYQAVKFDFKADLTGTGNRSRLHWLQRN